MDEPWFLRIKIHVLLNRASYLCGREMESMMLFYSGRFMGLEVCGLGFWNYFQVNVWCGVKKNPPALGLLNAKGSTTAQLTRTGNRPLLFLTYSLASTSGEYLSSIC